MIMKKENSAGMLNDFSNNLNYDNEVITHDFSLHCFLDLEINLLFRSDHKSEMAYN